MFGKDNRSASMTINDHGGAVAVYGKGSDESRTLLGVDEYSNGALGTWDKNGYRLK